MDPVAHMDGPYGQSGWTLWPVWMEPMASLDGPYGKSGWTLWPVWMQYRSEIIFSLPKYHPDFPVLRPVAWSLRLLSYAGNQFYF